MSPKLLTGFLLIASLLSFAQTAPPNYEEQGKSVVNDLVARHFDKVFALFDDQVAQLLPADKLAKSWDSLLLQTGDFQSIEKVRQEEKQGYQVVYVTCAFQRARRDFIIVLNAQGRIAQFASVPSESRTPWTPPIRP